MNKRQMKKQLKRNTVKDVYLEEDVYFGDSPTAIEIDENQNVVQFANDNWDDLLEANNQDNRIEFVKRNGFVSLEAAKAESEKSLGTTEKEKLAIREGLKAISDHERYMESEKTSRETILANLDATLNKHLYAEPEKQKGLIAKIKSFFKKG